MGHKLSYQNNDYTTGDGETVLDCLLREKIELPHSCKSGVCQSCLMQATEGEIPENSQEGLKPIFKKQKLFLSCQCVPTGDMKIQDPDEAGISIKAKLVEKEALNHNTIKICFKPDEAFDCEPGQYLTLINPEHVARSYSIANNPANDGIIELHVRVIKDGLMSSWLQNNISVGDEVSIRGPAGSCFYSCDGDSDYPIVLAGTGTGLAPLYGIINEALAKGHKGTIRLFHGALNPEDLYLAEALQELDSKYDNFTYTACVLNGEEGSFYQTGDIQELVLNNLTDKEKTHLYLCGAPELVNPLKTNAYISGIAAHNIFSDPFLPSKS